MTDLILLLALGDLELPEFEVPRRTVARLTADGVCAARRAATTRDAISLLETDDWTPGLAIVAQRTPEEAARSEVHRLLSLAPFTRWVCCLGPWCEGVGRTGIPWPLAVCVPARGSAGRILAEREVCARRRAALPLTGSRDEAFAFDVPSLPRGVVSPARVRIVTPDGALGEMLGAACRRLGCEAIIDCLGAEARDAHGSPSAADPRSGARGRVASESVTIFDVDPMSTRVAVLERWVSTHRDERVIAVTGSPCPSDAARLRALGVEAILSKLAALSELPALLSRVAPAASP